MKSNYIIRLITWEGEETQIPFRGSPRQADRVFIALAYALCESLYKYVFLAALPFHSSHFFLSHTLKLVSGTAPPLKSLI